MTKVVIACFFLYLISPLFYQTVDPLFLSIRKDYECEIFEKDFFIKDCYRNVELNLEDKKMIAGTHGTSEF